MILTANFGQASVNHLNFLKLLQILNFNEFSSLTGIPKLSFPHLLLHLIIRHHTARIMWNIIFQTAGFSVLLQKEKTDAHKTPTKQKTPHTKKTPNPTKTEMNFCL